MTIDRYTKTILTIIAVCLIWISVGGPSWVPTAHAQGPVSPTEIVLTGWKDATGNVWRLPTRIQQPTGTFISDNARRAFQTAQTQGLSMPVYQY